MEDTDKIYAPADLNPRPEPRYLLNMSLGGEGGLSLSISLSPCDFDLIPKMKEPLRGIRFRTVPEILQAVYRSIRTINKTGAAKGILRLPYRWQRVVNNAGDYIEGQ